MNANLDKIERNSTTKTFKPRLVSSQSAAAYPDILSSDRFVSGFTPPDYFWDEILMQGFAYSFTAQTGGGKTAIALRLLAHAGLGQPLAGHDVKKGAVLMLAGENPDDVRMRWIGLAEQMGFSASDINVAFRPGSCDVTEQIDELREYAESIGGLVLVVVDTSAAFFPGEDENSNTEIGNHARMLRQLTTLPGKPAVLINCHPTKNAKEDNLLPRGGGAFLAEVDGNLTAKNTDGYVEVHWQGKFRGPDFTSMAFELRKIESDKLVTAKGRRIPTVIAQPLSETEQTTKAEQTNDELQTLLGLMADHTDASTTELAKLAGWQMENGEPYKMKVYRLAAQLQKSGFVVKGIKSWTLTQRARNTLKSP